MCGRQTVRTNVRIGGAGTERQRLRGQQQICSRREAQHSPQLCKKGTKKHTLIQLFNYIPVWKIGVTEKRTVPGEVFKACIRLISSCITASLEPVPVAESSPYLAFTFSVS